MPGTRDARDRVMGATLDLIEQGGPASATPAAVAERAAASKMSVYRHFSGKDELLSTALAEREASQRRKLLDSDAARTPAQRMTEIFERLADEVDRDPDCIGGCPYVITEFAFADRDHPTKPVIAAHKHAMHADLAAMIHQAGCLDADEKADVILMLLDGAVVHARIRRSGVPLRRAAAAAAASLSDLTSRPAQAPTGAAGTATSQPVSSR